jgi:lipopolysaccharide/colanic/teichoic acid biosynthesis glycosyltransferase
VTRPATDVPATLPDGIPRPIEASAAFLGLVIAAPVLLICAAVIVLTSPGPPWYLHERVGRGGRTFRLAKLRTMRAGTRGPAITAGDDPRVTPIGRLLRRWKLDEIPQLWNVLRGEMSLVGPRPEAVGYVDPESPLWQVVLRVRPGLTDPATLQMRDEEGRLSRVPGDRDRYYRDVLLPAKLAVSRSYLERRGWRSDLGVLFRTLRVILAGPPGQGPKPSP